MNDAPGGAIAQMVMLVTRQAKVKRNNVNL